MSGRAHFSLRLAEDADRDIEDIWWNVAIESSNSVIADRLVQRIFDRYSILAEYPYLGPGRDHLLGAGRRTLTVGDYVIVYRVDENTVSILRIVHGRRDLPALFDL